VQTDANQSIASLPPKVMKELKARKLLISRTSKYWLLSRAEGYAPKLREQVKEVTLDVIEKHYKNTDEKSDEYEWTGPPIKPLNLNAKGAAATHGALHPLMKMRASMRNILLSMGFEEMETNRFVESSFWNFDALFQPQQHPARDAHDTFFSHSARDVYDW